MQFQLQREKQMLGIVKFNKKLQKCNLYSYGFLRIFQGIFGSVFHFESFSFKRSDATGRRNFLD